MKPFLATLVLMVCLFMDVGAQDIRSKVGPATDTNIIDPDKSIYGVPLGSSEDEFIKKFGQPNGYFKLNSAETVMFYGKRHAFVFTGSKLSGIRYSSFVFDWRLAQTIQPQSSMDGVRWELSNGIRMGMNRAEVKKILGDRLKSEMEHYFNSDKARVEIDFSHSLSEGDKDEAYKVFGIYVRQGISAAAQTAPKLYQPEIPEATKPCTDEVAKWWQEVRAAALEVFTVSQQRRNQLNFDIRSVRAKYVGLLREGQAKGYKAPVEDSTRLVILYFGSPPTPTKESFDKQIRGKILLRVECLADGTVGDVRVISGLGFGLDETAVKSVRDALYLPIIKDGVFTTSWTSSSLEFH